MIRRLLQFTLCLILCPLLAAEQVAPPSAPHPLPKSITVQKNTEIEFISLEAVSSATATKNQMVRLAVAKDVIINGSVAIPKGTLAMGKVHFAKGIPGKQDGSLRIEPSTLTLGNGRRVKLWESMYGEDDCANVGPCWVLWTLFAPIFLIGMVVERNDNPEEIHEGKDVSIPACERITGYIAQKIKLHPVDIEAIQNKSAKDATDLPCFSLH
jgi:hypothetical protein